MSLVYGSTHFFIPSGQTWGFTSAINGDTTTWRRLCRTAGGVRGSRRPASVRGRHHDQSRIPVQKLGWANQPVRLSLQRHEQQFIWRDFEAGQVLRRLNIPLFLRETARRRFVKISVISDRAGKIVGASFSPATGRSAAGPRVTDQIQIPDGHRVHQLALPPELAEEFLSGNFAQALSKCTLEIKGKSAKLKPAVSKK